MISVRRQARNFKVLLSTLAESAFAAQVHRSPLRHLDGITTYLMQELPIPQVPLKLLQVWPV